MENANKNLLDKTITSSFDEVANCENILNEITKTENFNSLNFMQDIARGLMQTVESPEISINNFLGNVELISVNLESTEPYANLISEAEFFKIVGFSNNKLSSRSGLYQESLYGHYLQAKAEKDTGYIADVLTKAIEFRDNLEFVKKLTKNKSFMEKWKANCGDISPVDKFKRTADLTIFNLVQAM